MKELDLKKAQKLLNRIMEFELAGVVRYTHYSLMVFGPNRIPIVAFMKAQASESLLHAQQAGELLTGLGGHPSLRVADIPESYQHSVKDILEESLAHERAALVLYKEFLKTVTGRSIYLEEFCRTQIGQEELHGLELRKMLRDIGAPELPPAISALGHTHARAQDAADREDQGDDHAAPVRAPKKKDKKRR
jgi:bacterioferritin